MNKLLEIRNLDAAYGGKKILKDVSLDVYEQDFLGIIGPNGGGKTTLLKLILGLMKPVSGKITYCREGLLKKIGYLPQINLLDRGFPIIVSEVIESGLISKEKHFRKEKLEKVITQMGLEEVASKPIGELSGGQLQRVLLGRAIVDEPELLILDEPNSYVDKRFESRFYEILKEINHQTAIILVSHDVGTVISLVKNIACVDETLHYHAGSDVDQHWLDEHYACPFELIAHGEVPHRILKNHDSSE